MSYGKKVLPILLLGAAFAGAGCNRSPARFTNEVAKICPNGWQVSASNDVIVIRRESPVWIIGKISPPAPIPGESDESYFKREGSRIQYEVRLRFVPRLSQPEYEKLKAARAEAAAKLRQPTSGKPEYTQLQKHLDECQVPVFFSEDYSIFLDRWAVFDATEGNRIEPIFINAYPAAAMTEADAIVEKLKTMFTPYPDAAPGKR